MHAAAHSRIPLWVKIAYTLFIAVLVPVYLRDYGPTNFLYFCDVTAGLTLAALWTENALLASMGAVAIVLPQFLWMLDLALHLVGWKVTGVTDYMFEGKLPLFTRALSLYHGWLPFLLLYLLGRLGYDRRALGAWLAVAWPLMLFCYFCTSRPGAPLSRPMEPVNINYVFGPTDEEPQHWMPAWAWLALMMVGLTAVFWVPAHAWFQRKFQTPEWSEILDDDAHYHVAHEEEQTAHHLPTR
jgi:hypothetical protein